MRRISQTCLGVLLALTVCVSESLHAGEATASVSSSVQIVVNIPVRTLLRISSTGVEAQANLNTAAGDVLITREVLSTVKDSIPPTTVTTVTTL